MSRVNSRKTTELRKPRTGGEYERGVKPPIVGRGRGGHPPDFFKKSVSENAFQTILKSIFPYSITSILN